MRLLLLLMALPVYMLTGCTADCNKKLSKLYTKNQKGLTWSQTVNGFTLSMGFLPTRMLPKAGDVATEKDSTAYYYFRLQVQCPPGNTKSNAASLNYGLDSLFSSSDGILSMPVLVEPVITGRQQLYEYLLVFPAEAFRKEPVLRVFFLDRLFTNNRLAFEFNRSIIEEIETLPCYATKA